MHTSLGAKPAATLTELLHGNPTRGNLVSQPSRGAR